MSVKDKLIEKLYRKSGSFTYDEAVSLLLKLGCVQNKKRTGGSSVSFYHAASGRLFQLHKPHPGNKPLLPYIIDDLIVFYELITR